MIQTLHHGDYPCAVRKGRVCTVSLKHDGGTAALSLRVGTLVGNTAQTVNSSVNHIARG